MTEITEEPVEKLPTFEVTWKDPDGAIITERIEAEHCITSDALVELRRRYMPVLVLAAPSVLSLRNVTELGPSPGMRLFFPDQQDHAEGER